MPALPSPATLPFSLSSTAVFITTWVGVRTITRWHGPSPLAGRYLPIHNKTYSLLSLAMAILIALDIFNAPLFANLSTAHLALAYHLSKLYEYQDILLVAAIGRPIGLHFAFHHLTTVYWTYYRALHVAGAWDWEVFALLNTVHHVLLYAYLGGWMKRAGILFYTQHLQLLGGIGWDLWRMCTARTWLEGEMRGRTVSVVLLSAYFVLYWRERAKSG